jgi:SWIM/SEC-C metal-binding protein
MVKLGSEKRPAIVRVQTPTRAEEILSICNKHGWQVIVGIELDKPEDISDVERLLSPNVSEETAPKVERNDPCPCGSGLKFKKCCSKKYESSVGHNFS